MYKRSKICVAICRFSKEKTVCSGHKCRELCERNAHTPGRRMNKRYLVLYLLTFPSDSARYPVASRPGERQRQPWRATDIISLGIAERRACPTLRFFPTASRMLFVYLLHLNYEWVVVLGMYIISTCK